MTFGDCFFSVSNPCQEESRMDIFRSFSLAIKSIVRDPVNLMLALFPTFIALCLYVGVIVLVFKNADYFGVLVQNYLPDPQTAGWIGKLLTAIFVLFVFLIMSWTFVLIVGIISAPFNSMLSSRIEDRLAGKKLEENRNRTFKEIISSLGRTFWDEFQKIFFIIILTMMALILNLFPVFYPIGLFILALLMAVQFVDYSWSRHELRFSTCMKDLFRNIIPYAASGLIFLILVSVPLINTLVPALATSYYTVLWLNRQKRLPQ